MTNEMAMIVRSGSDSAARLAEDIIAEIERPYALNECATSIGCSLGLSGWEDRSSPEELMQCVDVALSEAKRRRRGRAAGRGAASGGTRHHGSRNTFAQVQRQGRRHEQAPSPTDALPANSSQPARGRLRSFKLIVHEL
ncbi:MAG: diguanylate cyclase [Methylobacterium sp.]|nr:MAG: diguanylate cyclase [Methylobacterium sp.]